MKSTFLVFFLLFSISAYGGVPKTVKAIKPALKAPALNADDIIAQGETKLRGQSTQSVMQMTVIRPSYTRRLTLRSWTVGNDKALVEILDPPKETGVSSLRVESEMWNYLPKTDQVIRVPPSLMLQSWMGSDFTNDDLMKASSLSRDYQHRIVRRQKIDGMDTVLIECIPHKDAPVVWGKVLHWARVSDKIPVKQMFFDDQNKLVRTVLLGKFKKMDDRVVPTTMRVVKADSKDETTIVTYRKILYDRKVPNAVFDRDQVRGLSQEAKLITAGWFLVPHLRGSWR